ncbi:MAG: alpha-hydroxy-acid oxidizing protein [Herpetosiphonaceae bacterium]|nr:alpha-hydroxy-acid oxidizing protein [Herpetosiphonaceae bacterium]
MIEIARLDDLEPLARARVDTVTFDYIAGGADDERTMQENIDSYRQLHLVPRVLVDVSQRDTATTVLGTAISMPLLIAPMAFQGLVHPEAELATARAAAAAGTIMVASTMSNCSLEAIAEAAGPRWFQLYVYRDRAITRMLVERAVAAGYSALCVTVDTPLAGHRERDIRNRFTLPAHLKLANFAGTSRAIIPAVADDSGIAAYIAKQWDPSLTWKDIEWFASLSKLPIVVKGILSPLDARLAIQHGAAAIVVSNHGGRRLDTVPPAITQLPSIIAAVGDRCEVLLDGGIRRGTDLLKALALGAKAVLLGRPILWGLALDGQAGVEAVLQTIHTEFDHALALAGCPRVAAITGALVEQGWARS